VRRQRGDDAAAVRDVLTAAFADTGQVAGLAEALRARTDRQGSLVAVEQAVDAGDDEGVDRVVGAVHLSISWVDAPTRLVEVLTLSPLAVAPAYQRRGVGAALAGAAVAAAGELQAPLVILEGDPRYYGRLGWRPASGLGFTRPSVRIPDAGFQVFPLASYDPATMSGALVYNDTFWSLDFVGLRN